MESEKLVQACSAIGQSLFGLQLFFVGSHLQEKPFCSLCCLDSNSYSYEVEIFISLFPISYLFSFEDNDPVWIDSFLLTMKQSNSKICHFRRLPWFNSGKKSLKYLLTFCLVQPSTDWRCLGGTDSSPEPKMFWRSGSESTCWWELDQLVTNVVLLLLFYFDCEELFVLCIRWTFWARSSTIGQQSLKVKR